MPIHTSRFAWLAACVGVFVAGAGIAVLAFNKSDDDSRSPDRDGSAPFAIPTAADEESVCAWVGPVPLRVSLPESTARNVTPSPAGGFHDWTLVWPYETQPIIVGAELAVRLPNGTVVHDGDVGEVFCAGAEGSLYWPID